MDIEINRLLSEAKQYDYERSRLVKELESLETQARNTDRQVDSIASKRLEQIRDLEKSKIQSAKSKAKDKTSSYTKAIAELHGLKKDLMSYCSESDLKGYVPNSNNVTQEELDSLFSMIREGGLIAAIRRLFRIGGYKSRKEMAIDLCKKIEDADLYYSEKLLEYQSELDNQLAEIQSESRKDIDEVSRTIAREQQMRKDSARREVDAARKKLADLDSSSRLLNMHAQVKTAVLTAENMYGKWGEYNPPATMPEKTVLCNRMVLLPCENGKHQLFSIPQFVTLDKTNLIFVTSKNESAGQVTEKKQRFISEFLYRLIKTIPPERCSYTVFDPIRKGSNLGRLIDLTNLGTTDIKFDLFTSNDGNEKTNCYQRRDYLKNQTAEIIKYIAAKFDSLYELNKKAKKIDFPLNWIFEFDVPDDPDEKMLKTYREMFMNAQIAGYSFLFSTTPGGMKKIMETSAAGTGLTAVQIDLDSGCLIDKSGQNNISLFGIPNSDQQYNYVVALKSYYEGGKQFSNRITDVLIGQGLKLRDPVDGLNIPMGIDSRGNVISLSLGSEDSAHCFISGGTGSGKSTLLRSVITSACLHYSPDDLEIWLADFKQTEFNIFKSWPMPQIKVVGVSKTEDFSCALLDKIIENGEYRSSLFSKFNVVDFKGYRKHKGEPGYVNIPRLLVIVDEFHEMSQFVSDASYQKSLENVIREYRAQGITCLFADQGFSMGLSGLTTVAKNQFGLRIAMKNERDIQEIKATLAVDKAFYSDNFEKNISMLGVGEFIMRTFVKDENNTILDIKLDKYKALLTTTDDVRQIAAGLRSIYKAKYNPGELIYVNTNEQVPWNESDTVQMDKINPVRRTSFRLYLGRTATMIPCFFIDLGKKPDENLGIVGGTVAQRYDIIRSIMNSAITGCFKLNIYCMDYSDFMVDYEDELTSICSSSPYLNLLKNEGAWCASLAELYDEIQSGNRISDTLCLFIGLEEAISEFERLPERDTKNQEQKKEEIPAGLDPNFLAFLKPDLTNNKTTYDEKNTFNIVPILKTLFEEGARAGVRCAVEASVVRKFNSILKIRDMCRHRIAFDMSSNDCMDYLGNSRFQKNIGDFAVYSSGEKDVKKLIPYKY